MLFSDLSLEALLRLNRRRRNGVSIGTLRVSVPNVEAEHLALMIEQGWVRSYPDTNGNKTTTLYAITDAGIEQIDRICKWVNSAN